MVVLIKSRIQSLILLSLFFPNTLIKGQTTESLPLKVTYPAFGDTFALDHVWIAGYTDPDARLTISGSQVKVYPHGAFVSRVNLEPLLNRISLKADKNGQIAEEILFIYRLPDKKPIPRYPLKIDDESVYPDEDIWLRRGDDFEVEFRGSPGARATVNVEKIGKNIPMLESPVGETHAMPGVYTGVVIVPHDVPIRPLEIKVELRDENQKVQAKAPGRAIILPDNVPIIGKILKETYFFADCRNYSPIQRMTEGIPVHIIGKFDSRYKVLLARNRAVFVDQKAVKLQPLGSQIPNSDINAPTITTTKEWYKLSMAVETPLPYTVEQQIDPVSLDLFLYGARLSSHWITYPNNRLEISHIDFAFPSEGILKIHIALDQKQLWGYKVAFEDKSLNLYIRRSPPPVTTHTHPTQGLIFAIDPGHGGSQDGALSPIGIKEKDINMLWARYLAEYLRNAGATVILTRERDEDKELQERIDIARRADAHIFVSLHNNSAGPAGNVLAARGTSTYFTMPQAKDLAWTIYPYLVNLGLTPYGRVYNSYYVTNTPDMITVLLEGAFLSNPEDEQLLMNEQFVRKMANAVFEGITAYIIKYR